MSHSVKIILIADQEIKILGNIVNIHDLTTVVLNKKGEIVEYYEKTIKDWKCNNDIRMLNHD